MLTLYYSDNLNPRLCVAAARYLEAPVRYQAAAPLAPGNAEAFAPLNPNLRVPVLAGDDGPSLWETDAIVCQLSRRCGRTDFFPDGELLPEMLRWLSWSAMHWGQACSGFYFQHLVVPRYGLAPLSDSVMAGHAAELKRLAPILDAHLAQRRWMLGDTLTYADFRVGAALPFAQQARIDLSAYPAISRWAGQLAQIPAWANPFEGL
ncbi:glutathione S-transferase family protein [Roseateles cellulosilyticus]|uniref:Glutathione S-transferase family protein n=1 Tax=Pelomonas cellulosilytica TaxID=2906762 RepID=A0ABS8XXH9_9BURK|nr:glutathione S-transferase family protein [Pelomonas sp. P8]MCE4555419.1 glutathione S-transferase family protein [Pelomonas sp. P8]